MWITVNASILNNAEISEESKGTVPELLKEAAEALAEAKDYENLDNLPAINGHTLSGDKTPDELGLQKKLTAGNNVEIDATGRISAKDTSNYNELTDKPQINGVTLSGNKAPSDLSLIRFQSVSQPMTTNDCIDNNVLYHDEVRFDGGIWDAFVFAKHIHYDGVEIDKIYQFALLVDGRFIKRNKTTQQGQAGTWSRWEEIDSKIQSVTVNQNGTITFTNSDGSTVTTTGESVIGPQGPAGADGNDYVLTNQDKSDIADLVLAQLPTTQGVLYGN
jgi:hypothetical protein